MFKSVILFITLSVTIMLTAGQFCQAAMPDEAQQSANGGGTTASADAQASVTNSYRTTVNRYTTVRRGSTARPVVNVYPAAQQPPVVNVTNEIPEEMIRQDAGFPWWGWLLLGLGIVALVGLFNRPQPAPDNRGLLPRGRTGSTPLTADKALELGYEVTWHDTPASSYLRAVPGKVKEVPVEPKVGEGEALVRVRVTAGPVHLSPEVTPTAAKAIAEVAGGRETGHQQVNFNNVIGGLPPMTWTGETSHKETPKETPRERPKETPRETPKETPRERPKETPRETPKETPPKGKGRVSPD